MKNLSISRLRIEEKTLFQPRKMSTCPALGIKFRPVVCTFKWHDQPILYPEHLQKILDEHSWLHGHNFVQIQNSSGDWIDIDITWDQPLSAHGFKCFPQDWDGESSFVGVQKIVDRWDDAKIADKKEELIASLTNEQKQAREQFLKGFIEWIDSIHASK